MRITSLFLVLVMACGSDDRPAVDAPPGSGDAGGDAGSDAPDEGGAACGGIVSIPCEADEYCDYVDNNCGIADGAGRCKRRPDACPLNATSEPLIAEPTCACDGKVYSSECEAYAQGYDVNASGSCAFPKGQFACGYKACNLASQYCQHTVNPETSDAYECMPLPACTGDASCACVEQQPCGSECRGDAATGLTLTCS